MKSLETIASKALLLPKDQRLTLAHRILASLEPKEEPGAAGAWDREIRERIKAYDSGLTPGTPGHGVFADLDRKLKG